MAQEFPPVSETPRPAQCISCLERAPFGLWCSMQKHYICTSADCLVSFAETDEAFVQTKFGRVPCCGNTEVPPRCTYPLDAFLAALSTANGANGDRGPALQKRKDVLWEKFGNAGKVFHQPSMEEQEHSRGGASAPVVVPPIAGFAPAELQKPEEHASASSEAARRKTAQKSFVDCLLAELNLRCPNKDCRKFQDPDPKGCCNMQCRWCGERFCWACFQCGFADKVDVYAHLVTHKFKNKNHYYPTQEEVDKLQVKIRREQVLQWLTSRCGTLCGEDVEASPRTALQQLRKMVFSVGFYAINSGR